MPQTNPDHLPSRRCGRVRRHFRSGGAPPYYRVTVASVIAAGLIVHAPTTARADEGGISFWLPGLFGSLAAAPLQPGLSLTTFWYNDNVHAGAAVTRAREVTIGDIPITANANLSGNVKATAELAIFDPTYAFATPVLGGQLAVGLLGFYGRLGTSLGGDFIRHAGNPIRHDPILALG